MKASGEYCFCTLFDSFYLTRGIALYRSLELYCDNFHLYIFAFDDKSLTILEKLNLRHATIISLKDFENEELIRVKPTRTIAEYCWTCAASTIWYSINKFDLDHCTYLDVDLLFFSSPDLIYDEIGNSSIGITPHNFSPKYKSSEVYGKYCVQFTYFKNDTIGMEALNWWKNSCIEWCYAKMEDGKYGDQKYLDYFEKKFKNLCVISNIGAGVAPWNILSYNIRYETDTVLIVSKKKPEKEFRLVFYHYQGLKFFEKGDDVIAEPSILKIPNLGLKYIYKPYINELILIRNQIGGDNVKPKRIIFKRNKIKSIGTLLKINLKSYRLIREIFYILKKTRYNRPEDLGSVIK